MSEINEPIRKLFEKLSRKVGKTIFDYNLIENKDRVLVGLSGGKDSMILLETLADRKKHLPVSFDLFAIHVMATNVGYTTDTDYLVDFCKELNVTLFLEKISVDFERKPEKPACFICSWERRKKIFEKSKELNCNKIALGHHNDDAIETMLMNMIYHGSYSSLPQKFEMFEGRVSLIRPLLMIPEKDLIFYAALRNFKAHEKSCPYEDVTRRNDMRNLLEFIEKLNKDARKNLFRAMDKIHWNYLPKKKTL
jgi:tRNA(Ile)-lysidine synthetase-like protein